MNIFYKSDKNEERYVGGQFARRPLIPDGEVWLFQRADGDHVIVYGSDNPEDALPPPAPWFRAMTIYKFWRSRTLPWSLTLFADLQYPVTLTFAVLLSLRDPTLFMNYLQSQGSDTLKQKDLQDLFPELEKTFRATLNNEIVGRTSHSRSGSQQELLLPLALNYTRSEEDLSWYIQSGSEAKRLGLDIRLIVQKTSLSDAYKKLVDDCISITQKVFIELKQTLTVAAARYKSERSLSGASSEDFEFDPLSQQEHIQTNFYKEHEEKIRSLRLPFSRLLDEVPGQGVPQDAVLRTVLFNEVIYQLLDQAAHHTFTAQLPSLNSTSFSPSYRRTEYIRNFYLIAQAEGWTLFPIVPEKVKEEIKVNLDQENHLLLIVPDTYPHSKTKPTITNVMIQGERIPQEEVNKALEPFLQSDDYIPMSAIQAVIDAVSAQNLISLKQTKSEPITPIEPDQEPPDPTSSQ
jgi:hypothetical protein